MQQHRVETAMTSATVAKAGAVTASHLPATIARGDRIDEERLQRSALAFTGRPSAATPMPPTNAASRTKIGIVTRRGRRDPPPSRSRARPPARATPLTNGAMPRTTKRVSVTARP